MKITINKKIRITSLIIIDDFQENIQVQLYSHGKNSCSFNLLGFLVGVITLQLSKSWTILAQRTVKKGQSKFFASAKIECLSYITHFL